MQTWRSRWLRRRPSSAPSGLNESTSALKQMENITYFMNAARDMGMPESSMYGTPDPCEQANTGSEVEGVGELREAVQVNVPECGRLKLDSPSVARHGTTTAGKRGGLTSQTAQPMPARTQISTQMQLKKKCSSGCESRGRECRGRSSKRCVLSLAKSAGLRSSQHGGAGRRSRLRGAELRQQWTSSARQMRSQSLH